MAMLLLLVVILLVLCTSFVLLKWRYESGEGRVLVVVLGDVGRSPRMQYHCLSLLKAGYAVDIVGYGGSQLVPELKDSCLVNYYKLLKISLFLGTPSLMKYFVKVSLQICNLLWVIFVRTRKSSHVLVQTPPSVPTLFVCVLVCWMRNSKLIVDIHNYGYTLLALTLGNGHPLVRISRRYEEVFSRFAHSIICVSDAMKRDLEYKLGISATVFHDRPPMRFKPTDLDQKHKLFLKLSADNPTFKDALHDDMTIFTEAVSGRVRMRKDRPFLLVSSTSWTKDEDFNILLEALEEYNKAASNTTGILPKLLCVITGKGPLKQYYTSIMQSKNFSSVTICTMWLSAEDYPILLGSADLGVCLHKSSSGLDLPMKVVDMFGCGLPVCALNFECLDELVKHELNGMVFSCSTELSAQIQGLCRGFPENNHKLMQYRKNLSTYQTLRWDHYWKMIVLPIIKNV